MSDAITPAEAPINSAPRCAWNSGDIFNPGEPCATGKPPLFYSCNESGPVCEDHVCGCRPSLLTERANLVEQRFLKRLENVRQAGQLLSDIEESLDDLVLGLASIHEHFSAAAVLLRAFQRRQETSPAALSEKEPP